MQYSEKSVSLLTTVLAKVHAPQVCSILFFPTTILLEKKEKSYYGGGSLDFRSTYVSAACNLSSLLEDPTFFTFFLHSHRVTHLILLKISPVCKILKNWLSVVAS